MNYGGMEGEEMAMKKVKLSVTCICFYSDQQKHVLCLRSLSWKEETFILS